MTTAFSREAFAQISILELQADTPILAVGESVQIRAELSVDNVPSGDLTNDPATVYKSIIPAIATVNSSGLVTAIAPGSVTIVAENAGVGLGGVRSMIGFTVHPGDDRDGDGIPNDFEIANGLDPNNPADSELDPDQDGLTNYQEFLAGTSLTNPDTDGDGVPDKEEIVAGRDALTPDNPPPPPFTLNENCIVSVLNRTAQVQADGVWVLPNVPANMGRVRARATCVENGITRSGQSDYIIVPVNGVLKVGEINFDAPLPIPANLSLTAPQTTLTSIGATVQLTATVSFSDGRTADVSLGEQGTNYSTSNSNIASVSENGFVTARASGAALVTALNEGAIGMLRIAVISGGDTDGDGMPDDYEVANGLDPNDPLDALLDPDGDGLTNLQEFQLGTDPRNADSDGDGLNDGDEIARDTNPLLRDTDGDGISDGLEIQTGSDPLDPNSFNLAQALQSIQVTPASFTLVFNTILGEASQRLRVTGRLIDGDTIDLTSRSRGTNYSSSDLTTVNFGAVGGQVFAGADGTATVTVTNSGFTATSLVTVTTFSPRSVSSLTIAGSFKVDVSGRFAYVVASAAGLHVVDVQDRATPALIATLDTPGSASDVKVVGNIAYVADGASGLQIVDVSNPLAPTSLAALDTPGNAVALAVSNNRAFVADSASGLQIIDVSNPLAPTLLGTINTGASAVGVDVSGNLAIVASGSGGLKIIGVSNPASPLLRGSIATTSALDVVVDETIAYVADSTGSLKIIDFSIPSAPRLLATTSRGLGGILNDVARVRNFVFGSDIFFVNGVPIIEVGDPTSPNVRVRLDFPGDANGTGIAADDQYVYLIASGRLFIGQYVQLNDNAGIPPTVTLTAPQTGQNAIEGGKFKFAATATDDILVAAVDFLVDGAVVGRDTTAPFEFTFRVPIGATSFTVSARAVDLGGNTGASDPVTVNVVPDTVPPAVIGTIPSSGVTNFPVDGIITVFFDERIDPASVVPGTIRLFRQGTTEENGVLQLTADGEAVSFTPTAALADQTSYLIRVAGLDDLFGNRMTSVFESSFTVDRLPPLVLLTNPSANLSGVPINAPYTVEFNKVMAAETLTPENFTLRDNITGQTVPGTLRINPGSRSIVYAPNRPLGAGRNHTMILSTNITDTLNNRLTGARSFAFTTGFGEDREGPSLLRSHPESGQTGIPLNAKIVLEFSEPINAISATRGIQVSRDGQAVAGMLALSDGNRVVTFTPNVTLTANATYTVNATTEITDLVGNPLGSAVSFTFVTGGATDTTAPTVTQFDPANGATNVPTNTFVQLRLSERINPLSVSTANFFIFEAGTGLRPAGTISLSTDRQTVVFTPSAALQPATRYFADAFSITDLAGQAIGFFRISFTTADTSDATPPRVVTVSPPDGITAVPVNARVVVDLSEAVVAQSVGPDAVVVAAGGVAVAGALSLNTERTSLTFVPAAALATSTEYTVTVSGFTDRAGNPVTPFTSRFTTRSSATPDTVAPGLLTISPAPNTTGVDVNTAIVLTFNDALDPTTVHEGTVRVFVEGFSGVVAGSYQINGNVVTFTPLNPLPGNVRVFVDVRGVRDLVGNASGFFRNIFTTAAVPDTTPPQVVNITPTDGATDVGPNAVVVLTFSESLNAATVNNNTFALFNNGVRINPGISRSADNRTVFLTTTLPAASTLTVVVTNAVEDLSGNRMADFRSEFTTATSFGPSRPSVVTQRPGNGAANVPPTTSVVLYTNKPMNPASVTNALRISQNGVIINGTTRVSGNDQTIEFTPAAPLTLGALIQVFLDPSAEDTSGNALNNYQGSFRITPDTSATAPTVVRTSHDVSTTDVPRNTVIEVEYNEPLDPTTVNDTTVVLRQNTAGNPVIPATVTLERGGRVIRIMPVAPLTANTQHFVDITTAVRDLDGQGPNFFRRFFTTGADSDTAQPTVVAVTPPPGAIEVGVNAAIRVRFNELINPLSVSGETVLVTDGTNTAIPCTINFSNNNQDVLLVPHNPLPDATVMTLTVAGVEDRAGNPVVPQTTQFTTRAGPDLIAPLVARVQPFQGATDVPVNTTITLEFNEPIDPSSVDGTSLFLRDNVTRQAVPGTHTVSVDGRVVVFVPDAPLGVGRSHVLFVAFRGIRDVSNNLYTAANFSFTTALTADTAAPQVLGISPEDGIAAVPTNARIVIAFDEPIQTLGIEQVTLRAGGVEIAVNRVFSNGNRTLTLTPQRPLAGLTLYTVTVDGVRDLAGNPLAAPLTSTFTTGTGVDLVAPTVTQFDPANGATNVPTNTFVQLRLSERINPLSVSTANFFIFEAGTGLRPAGTISLSTDRQTVVFTPSAALQPATRYFADAFSITDLAGQAIGFFRISFTTAP